PGRIARARRVIGAGLRISVRAVLLAGTVIVAGPVGLPGPVVLAGPVAARAVTVACGGWLRGSIQVGRPEEVAGPGVLPGIAVGRRGRRVRRAGRRGARGGRRGIARRAGRIRIGRVRADRWGRGRRGGQVARRRVAAGVARVDGRFAGRGITGRGGGRVTGGVRAAAVGLGRGSRGPVRVGRRGGAAGVVQRAAGGRLAGPGRAGGHSPAGAAVLRRGGPVAVRGGRARLKRGDQAGYIAHGKAEAPGAGAALPDAEHRHAGVGIPADPQAPGRAPDVEEHFTETWQRSWFRRRHGAHSDADLSDLSTELPLNQATGDQPLRNGDQRSGPRRRARGRQR